MNKLYNENSIQSLAPRDFTRLRPGVYAGSTEYSTQLLIEIVSNAIDEFKAGHGNVIEVTINKDNSCSVRDYGQGFLVNNIREDGKSILQASFDTLNTSGKFTEDGVYEGTALGLNGIGSKLTNFLSHWLEVTTYRDGKFEKINFNEGVFKDRKVGSSTEANGTYVVWMPSEEFFTNIDIELNKIKEMFHILTCLCSGLTIKLKTPTEEIEYYSKSGLNDLINDKVEDTELIKNRLNINFENGKNKLDFVMTYTSKYSLNMISYVNTGETDSGPHITQIKTLLTREFNKFFKEKKWLKEKDSNFTGDDIQEGLFIAFNLTAPGVSYDAQTKSRIVKIDMTPFTSVLTDALKNWFNSNEKEIKLIFDKAASAKKAREAAKKAKERIRENDKKKSKLLISPKLADCNNTNRKECELFVVEGDSAAGNMKSARNKKTQAIFPVRGKIRNCQKATAKQILDNLEITTLISAIGLNFNPTTLKCDWDEKKLRYGKIIIAADGDADGRHIKNLFYTCLWNICPELFEFGYVYALYPPLFVIKKGKDERIFLQDEKALAEYKKNHPNEKYTLSRNKGLGEQDEDETEEVLLNPNNRVLKKIVISDKEKTQKMFNDLMGTKPLPRKEFIQKKSKEAKYFE